MSFDAHKDRTALRLKLYQGGFSPLANKSKMCLIKGWSTIEVTPALIQSKEWARSREFQDTGIRCGDVVALDWDVDDGDLLNDLLDEVVNQGLVNESLFVRIGRPPRELWVYRTSEKIGKRTTGHFAPKGAPDDHKGFAVEVLGAGCQFAAYGQRDAKTEYSWPELSLVDAQYMDLPEITKAQADAVRDFAAAFFEARGLERRSPAGGTDKGYTHTYDLTDDMVFDVHDMGEMTVAEIREALRASPEGEVFRCKVETLRPTGGSWAGMVSLVGGDVCLSDHGTYTSHFPLEADARRGMEALGRLLEARFPKPLEGPPEADDGTPQLRTDLAMDARKPFDDNLEAALHRYVYVVTDGLVCDAQTLSTQKMRNFHDAMGPYRAVKQGPKGGEQIVRLSEQWRDHPSRVTAETMQMRPDMARPLFVEDGALHFNTYEPVRHTAAGGDARIGLAMIANLLPIEIERQFFLRWLSYKIQNPMVPGPAIVMVARDAYGTGRGSLIALMTDILGERYVNPVDFATLTGQGSQSQYNEWQSDSLLVTVDEARETMANISSWQTRNNAYEHLKNVVDPSGRGVHVKRKGVKNSKARTFASIFIATNHGDALVIPANDRRIAVLENGETQPPEYWSVFHQWRANRANVAALVQELLKLDLAGYNPYEVPMMTASKADMVEAGTSELDRALNHALQGLGDTLVVKEQILLRVEDYLADVDVEVPDDWRRMIDRMLVRRTRKTPVGVQDRVRIDGKQRIVRVIGKPKPETFQGSQEMITEVQKNGPLLREIKTSHGKVVQFPQRGS